jgi:hypothetical protein
MKKERKKKTVPLFNVGVKKGVSSKWGNGYEEKNIKRKYKKENMTNK